MPAHEIKTLGDGKTVQLGGRLTMKQFRKWVKAEGEGDFDVAYSLLAGIVEKWDYPGDPRNPASYDDLTLAEYREINLAVGEWIKGEIAAKN